MTGTTKNKSNKIWQEMERDNNEVAQDGVESAASLLPGEGGRRLSGEVDEVAQTRYEQVKRIIYSVYSASFGMNTVLSIKSFEQRNPRAN